MNIKLVIDIDQLLNETDKMTNEQLDTFIWLLKKLPGLFGWENIGEDAKQKIAQVIAEKENTLC